ncbi:MAG: HAD-IA family hydrolase [Candidatus Binatia bacterium]
MAIEAIFFDAAGTLIKPIRPVGEIYTAIAGQYGMKASVAEVSERFRTCFHSAPPLAFPGISPGDIQLRERDWWRRLVQNVFEPWGTFERFEDCFAELFNYFAHPKAWMLYPEVSETLAALKQRDLSLAVVSNFDSRLHGILKGLSVDRCFTEIIVSSHVGYVKPAREIFQAALDRHGLASESALHVGDSEENDLLGAVNAGLRGVLVDRKTIDKYAQDPSFRIPSLRDLLPIVDELQRQP